MMSSSTSESKQRIKVAAMGSMGSRLTVGGDVSSEIFNSLVNKQVNIKITKEKKKINNFANLIVVVPAPQLPPPFPRPLPSLPIADQSETPLSPSPRELCELKK